MGRVKGEGRSCGARGRSIRKANLAHVRVDTELMLAHVITKAELY